MIGYWLMNPNGVLRSNFVVPYSTSLESSNAMHLFSLTIGRLYNERGAGQA